MSKVVSVWQKRCRWTVDGIEWIIRRILLGRWVGLPECGRRIGWRGIVITVSGGGTLFWGRATVATDVDVGSETLFLILQARACRPSTWDRESFTGYRKGRGRVSACRLRDLGRVMQRHGWRWNSHGTVIVHLGQGFDQNVDITENVLRLRS